MKQTPLFLQGTRKPGAGILGLLARLLLHEIRTQHHTPSSRETKLSASLLCFPLDPFPAPSEASWDRMSPDRAAWRMHCDRAIRGPPAATAAQIITDTRNKGTSSSCKLKQAVLQSCIHALALLQVYWVMPCTLLVQMPQFPCLQWGDNGTNRHVLNTLRCKY